MNIWDLQEKVNNFGKAEWQPCSIIVTQAFPDLKPYNNVQFQNVTVMGYENTQMQSSVMFNLPSTRYPNGLTGSDLNKPIECDVRVTPDNSQFAVNGKKYTIRLEKSQGTGGFSGNKGGSPGKSKFYDPKKDFTIQLLALYKCAAELVSNGKLDIDNMDSQVNKWANDIGAKIDDRFAPKPSSPPQAPAYQQPVNLPQQPQDNIPI